MNGPEQRSRRGLALAVAALLVAASAAAQTPTEPAPAGASDGAGTDWRALLRTVRYELGPVRWRAHLTTDYRLQMPPGQATQRGFNESGNLSLASYLYQPWFAQLSGNLGFLRSSTSGDGDARSFGLFGGGGLSLFPASRFPFAASFNVSDTRANGEFVGSDYRSVSYGVRQSYRTLDNVQFSASLDRSQYSSAAIGKDVLDVASANVALRRGDHSYSADGYLSRNTGGEGGASTRIERLAGRHTYVPSPNLNIETLANYQHQDQDAWVAGARNAVATRFVQVGGFATWRPEEDEPLYDEKHPMSLSGAVRLTASGSEQDGVSADVRSLSGSAGVFYTVNPMTQLSANAALTHTNSSSTRRVTTSSLNASVTHTPPPIPIWSSVYLWNASTGGSGTTGAGASRLNLFAQANHQLTRDFDATDNLRLSVSASQGVGSGLTSAGNNTFNINHGGSVRLTLPGERTTQTYIGLTANDSRSFGESDSVFQLVNLQATRQAPLSGASFWSANLTVQGYRQRGGTLLAAPQGGSADSGFNVSTYGSLTYQHRRAFGVPRLRLIATYTAGQAQLQSRSQGDLNAPRETVSDSLEARLEYQIGKVDARLTFRSITADGKRNTGIFLRVRRNF